MADKPKNFGPPIGTVNVLEATIGQRGMGKSSLQCKRALELVRLAKGQAFVVGHSLGARLPRKLAPELGGDVLPLEYHRTIAELDKGLHARPANWHILAPPLLLDATPEQIAATCDDLIYYTIRLSDSLRDRAYAREHPLELGGKGTARNYDGIQCPMVIIIVDEGIAIESAGKGGDKKSLRKKDWFLEWIFSLRHLHTALLYAIQNASSRSWEILAEATRVIVFRVKHQWAINAVQAAGGTRREMRAVRKLLPHEYIVLGEDPSLADDLDELDEAADEGDDDESDETPDEKPDDKPAPEPDKVPEPGPALT